MDGSCTDVNPGADRFHRGGCDNVAGHRGRWRHSEHQHQHRGDECGAAHTGQAHQQPSEQATESQDRIYGESTDDEIGHVQHVPHSIVERGEPPEV